MAEDFVLVDPIEPVVPPTTVSYKVVRILSDREHITGDIPPDPGLVSITLRDNAGNAVYAQYNGEEAQDLIKWMNTANFSNNSMQKRILQKLMADGKLPPGTVQGTPDPPTVEL